MSHMVDTVGGQRTFRVNRLIINENKACTKRNVRSHPARRAAVCGRAGSQTRPPAALTRAKPSRGKLFLGREEKTHVPQCYRIPRKRYRRDGQRTRARLYVRTRAHPRRRMYALFGRGASVRTHVQLARNNCKGKVTHARDS